MDKPFKSMKNTKVKMAEQKPVKYITSIDCHVHALPSKHFKFDYKVLEEYALEANDKGIDAIVLS